MSYRHTTKLSDGSYIVSFQEGSFTGGYIVEKGDEDLLPENSGVLKRVDAHKQDRKEYVKEKKDGIGKVAREVVEKVNKVIKEYPEAENPFKKDDKVLYDGKPFIVVRAYVYKGKPYCILSDKRQVAANRLTLTKNK